MNYWVNQFAVAPDQPGGTRHHEMAVRLNGLGEATTVVASDLNLTTRSYARRRNHSDRRHVREDLDGSRFVWLPAGNYEANDWRRVASMVVFSLHALVFLLRAPMARTTVVIGSSPHLFAALAASIAAAVRRVPFVLEVRDLWPESYEGVQGRTGGALVSVMRALADHLYRRADAIVVLAEGNRGTIETRLDGRATPITYIPNGVALDGPPPTTDREQRRQVESFVYAGAHGPANGLDIAVEAARLLADKSVDDARIVLVGDGPAKAQLKASAAGLETIEFRDPLPKQAMPELFASARAGLMLLADVELFQRGVSPNKLFDYLAADLEVIGNVPGMVAKVIDAADAGRSVAPGDPAALAEAILDLARTPTRPTRGRAYIAQHHDRDRLARRLAGVIDSTRDG